MPGARRLWIGPHGSAVRERVLDEVRGGEPSDLWLVPTPLARAQVTHALAKRREAARAPRVWCWSDLWHAVRDGRATGPARLSEAGARAALRAAIARARREGELGAVDEVVEWPGFRRRLQAQIAAWTQAERPPESEPPGGDPARAAQWAIFSRYRAALKALDAEDAAGFAVWASKALKDAPSLKRLGTVGVLD